MSSCLNSNELQGIMSHLAPNHFLILLGSRKKRIHAVFISWLIVTMPVAVVIPRNLQTAPLHSHSLALHSLPQPTRLARTGRQGTAWLSYTPVLWEELPTMVGTNDHQGSVRMPESIPLLFPVGGIRRESRSMGRTCYRVTSRILGC